MRSYQQYCALARALDVIGDRWTLLIVRELLIGEARYSDLLKGLPGIATNLLATRLTELESTGLVRREVVPPPVAATVFRLTPRGAALRPVIYELGRWAAPLMTPPVPGEHMRARWIALPIEMYLHDRTPKAKPVAVQIEGDDEPIVIETLDGQVRARTGTVLRPDLVITGSPALALALLLGKASVTGAKTRGIRFKGNVKILDRLRMPRTG
ncbi:MAG: winged helix-turn-helix transcriptional regulator [Vicinamibacterales bacterium]